MNEETLFVAALGIADARERDAFLDSECQREPALRQRVERLLRVHRHAGGFLETPAQPECVPPLSFQQLLPESMVDRYRIVRLLGEGGMGAVYLADQLEPVERQIAFKVIKPGLESPQFLLRFEAERQALALLDHPHIAKVLDAGATITGQPYMAMEWVDGLSITEYCDKHRLHPKARLELVIKVCLAVQHAHQKGLIHRDIKPGNILVTEVDGQPVPKVIDFGVAKLIETENPRLAYQSFVGTLVGTLQYMSPEQAQLNHQNVDTRSDIYSLGVVLYELLAGSTPHLKVQLEKASIDDALRMIREVDPPKPSTRLSSLHETLASVSTSRLVEPRQLTSMLKGELDWIVMKALEKEPDRRYLSPLEMAKDLQRYLVHEPILASPPSRWYWLRMFVRRNRLAVAATVLVLLTLLAGIVGTSYGLIDAHASRQLAEQRYDVARNAVNQFLDSITDDPDLHRADLSELRARLLGSAVSYYQQLVDQDTDNLSRQWDRAHALYRLGSIRYYRGEFTQAEKDFIQSRDEMRSLMKHPTVSIKARRQLGMLMNMLGVVHSTMGQGAEALANHEESERLLSQLNADGLNDTDSLFQMALNRSNLAFELRHRQRDKAKRLYLLSLQDFATLISLNNSTLHHRYSHATVIQNYAELVDDLGDFAHAHKQIALSVNLLEQVVSQSQAMTYRRALAGALSSHSRILNRNRQPALAMPLAQRAKSIAQELVREFPSNEAMKSTLANVCHQLGWSHQMRSEWQKAAPEFEQACSIREKLLVDSPNVPSYLSAIWQSYVNLGLVQSELQQKEQALAAFTKAAAHLEKYMSLIEASIALKESLSNIILNISYMQGDQSRYAEATKEIDRALAMRHTSEFHLWRAAMLVMLGRHQEAVDTAMKTCSASDVKQADVFFAVLVCSLATDEARKSGASTTNFSETGMTLLKRIIGQVTDNQHDNLIRNRWGSRWVASRTTTYKSWIINLGQAPTRKVQ